MSMEPASLIVPRREVRTQLENPASTSILRDFFGIVCMDASTPSESTVTFERTVANSDHGRLGERVKQVKSLTQVQILNEVVRWIRANGLGRLIMRKSLV